MYVKTVKTQMKDSSIRDITPIALNGEMSELFEDGRKIYTENPFLRDIATFMENPENRQFYTKYFTKRTQLEEVLFFLHMYHILDEQTKSHDLNGFHKLSLLLKFIDNNEIRHQLSVAMKQWLNKETVFRS